MALPKEQNQNFATRYLKGVDICILGESSQEQNQNCTGVD
jgi:hypothetical protein